MKDRDSINWLQLAPALLAIGLGGIYAFGAISVLGQFQAADLDALQTMPLVPIDQILARGIGAITQAAALSLPFALFGAIGVFKWDEQKAAAKKPKDEGSQENGEDGSARSFWILLALILAAVLFVPSDYLSILGFGLGSMIVVINAVRKKLTAEGRLWRSHAFVAGYAAFVLTATATGSIVRADPLPKASLALKRGTTATGGLLASTGSGWYIARNNGNVIAIPAGNVKSVEIVYSDAKTDASLFNELLH